MFSSKNIGVLGKNWDFLAAFNLLYLLAIVKFVTMHKLIKNFR